QHIAVRSRCEFERLSGRTGKGSGPRRGYGEARGDLAVLAGAEGATRTHRSRHGLFVLSRGVCSATVNANICGGPVRGACVGDQLVIAQSRFLPATDQLPRNVVNLGVLLDEVGAVCRSDPGA